MPKAKYLIGIDEAGRGPLAGPVAVGVVMLAKDFNWQLLPGVGDSKKVSPKKRLVIFKQVIEMQRAGLLNYAVVLKSAKMIDRIGIVPSINESLQEALQIIENNFPQSKENQRSAFSDLVAVKLDGELRAPTNFKEQETIIKGDAKELVIGLASIMAKVTRDYYMESLAKKSAFAKYNFATHKGYGTKMHRDLIKEHGLSKEHRVSFCRNILLV